MCYVYWRLLIATLIVVDLNAQSERFLRSGIGFNGG